MAQETGPVDSIEAPGMKIEGNLLRAMRDEVAQLLGRRNTIFPGAQPVSFARRHIAELMKTEYVNISAISFIADVEKQLLCLREVRWNALLALPH